MCVRPDLMTSSNSRALASKACDQLLGGRHEVADQVQRGDAHRGREDVVGGLGHVDVVVGADDGVVAALARADALGMQQLDGPVRQHLVGVHVVAGAGAGLERVDPEVVDQLGLLGGAGGLEGGLHRVGRVGAARASSASSVSSAHGFGRAQDLVGRLDDGVAELLGQPAGGHVGARGGLLDLDDGAHQGRVRQRARDREVVDAARGLDAVVGGVGDFEVAERVLLDTEPGAGSRGRCGSGRSGRDGGRLRLA